MCKQESACSMVHGIFYHFSEEKGCPPGQEFVSCAKQCLQRCADLQQGIECQEDGECQTGCRCPEGKEAVIFHNTRSMFYYGMQALECQPSETFMSLRQLSIGWLMYLLTTSRTTCYKYGPHHFVDHTTLFRRRFSPEALASDRVSDCLTVNKRVFLLS